jgi:hypothetical protein
VTGLLVDSLLCGSCGHSLPGHWGVCELRPADAAGAFLPRRKKPKKVPNWKPCCRSLVGKHCEQDCEERCMECGAASYERHSEQCETSGLSKPGGMA